MGRAIEHVVDAIDIETFLLAKDEEDAKALAEALIQEMNLNHGDIVFLEHRGWGARVRIRTYVNRPGDHYSWLDQAEDA